MTDRTEHSSEDLSAVVWSLIVMQGAVLITSSLESFIANAVQGFALLPVFALTVGAAVLTLLAARGVRASKRWARRVTLVAEWFLITVGSVEVVASLVLTGASVDLMPLLSLIVVPGAVLVGLRRLRLAAGEPDAAKVDRPSESPVAVAAGEVG